MRLSERLSLQQF